MCPCLKAEQCAGTERQGGHDHVIVMVFGKAPRRVVLPSMRRVPSAWVRLGAGSVEDYAPSGAIAPPLVHQGAAYVRRFR